MCSVLVIRATNVMPSDPSGKSDPYCLVYLLGSESDKALKTDIKYSNLEPIWDERFVLYSKDLEPYMVMSGVCVCVP